MPCKQGTPHVADAGTAFTLTFQVCAVALDISTATLKEIWFTRPDGILVKKTAMFVTTGVDGKIRYIADVGFLDVPGKWKMQGYVEMPAGNWHTDEDNFLVKSNIGS